MPTFLKEQTVSEINPTYFSNKEDEFLFYFKHFFEQNDFKVVYENTKYGCIELVYSPKESHGIGFTHLTIYIPLDFIKQSISLKEQDFKNLLDNLLVFVKHMDYTLSYNRNLSKDAQISALVKYLNFLKFTLHTGRNVFLFGYLDSLKGHSKLMYPGKYGVVDTLMCVPLKYVALAAIDHDLLTTTLFESEGFNYSINLDYSSQKGEDFIVDYDCGFSYVPFEITLSSDFDLSSNLIQDIHRLFKERPVLDGPVSFYILTKTYMLLRSRLKLANHESISTSIIKNNKVVQLIFNDLDKYFTNWVKAFHLLDDETLLECHITIQNFTGIIDSGQLRFELDEIYEEIDKTTDKSVTVEQLACIIGKNILKYSS